MASSLVDIETEKGLVPLQILTVGYSSERELIRNIKKNIQRDTIRFMSLPGLLMARNQPLAIVAGGPSLDNHLDKIREFDQVMVCGSAHDHLVDAGIIPSFAIAVDANRDAVDYFSKPQQKTSYLLSSQCNPNMFDHLESYKVAMWHFKGQVTDDSVYNGEPQINWGCMIGVMSLQLALYLGFQHLHFFGFDCSYAGDEHHAYDVGKYAAETDEKKQIYKVKGREFTSTMALIAQMEHLFDVFASSDGSYLKGTVYGDGMWANVIKESPPEMSQWLEAPDARGS